MSVTALYRAYDKAGELLYVGITNNWARRFGDHARDSQWLADAIRIDLEHFADRAAARAAEIKAIQTERPRWNVADREGSHFRDVCPHCDAGHVETYWPVVWMPNGSGWTCGYVCTSGHQWACWNREIA